MHQHAEMVGLDCAATVLGMIGHGVVAVAVAVAVACVRRCRDRDRSNKSQWTGQRGQRRVYDMI